MEAEQHIQRRSTYRSQKVEPVVIGCNSERRDREIKGNAGFRQEFVGRLSTAAIAHKN